MPTGTGNKTVKINSVFEVVDPAGTASPRGVIKDLNFQVTQVTNFDPWCIPGSTVDQPISFGGVTLAKRLFISTDQQVTLKLDNVTDTGFTFGPGEGIISSAGITGMWITTGANDTNVEVIIAGDWCTSSKKKSLSPVQAPRSCSFSVTRLWPQLRRRSA